MRREPHENVATVLVDPLALRDLELALMEHDLWVWPIETAPFCPDGPRLAFQVRRRMLMAKRGAWEVAADWTPVWISFGESWREGDEPLPWSAHQALWQTLALHRDAVRYRLGLGGVPRLPVPQETVS